MDPNSVAASARQKAVETIESRESELDHICAAHPLESDGPCGPGCKAYCGIPWDEHSETCVDVDLVTPDSCVVCESMFQGRLS